MRRIGIAAFLMFVLGNSTAARAVDLTGVWAVCADCRVNGFCHPLGTPTFTDTWTITQTSSDLAITTTSGFGPFAGTIDPMTGIFDLPDPPNVPSFEGVGRFDDIDGSYFTIMQSGALFGARLCDPMAPACDDGTTCTDDLCIEDVTVGTCTDMPPVDVCMNVANGSCTTTTTTTSTSTTSSTTLPFGHHPMTGSRLLLKRSASGKQTLVFVSKDPTVYAPTPGATDDPSIVGTQIELFSPPGNSPLFAITIPAGLGVPGWSVSPIGPVYKFVNASAPVGISVVRSVKLVGGKGLKIVARATGLPMTTPLGAAGIGWRLTELSGSLPIVCARFGASSVRRDVPPVFVAGTSVAPVNCHPATLRAP